MKKMFTLIAVALLAIGANAKQAIDFTKIDGFAYGTAFQLGSWDWKGITLAEGELIQDEAAKTADDSGVKYFDASAFDYVVVKYSASTIDVSLIAQYKCKGTIGQYGAEYEQGQATIGASATGGYAALALDADQKKTVNQIAIQGGNNAGSITIDEIYFATAEEWEAVKPAPAQTKDMLSSFTPTSTNDDGTKVFTAAGAWNWFGAWLGGFDASAFDYLVFELAEPAEVVVQAVIQHANGAADISGQIQPGELVGKVALSPEGKANISQVGLQNSAPGTFVVKAVYFATKDYVDNMAKPQTQVLPLSNLSSGWNSAYDTTTHVITIGDEGDEGGKGWWLENADYSDFDNVVIELEPATVAGRLVIEYVADGAEATSVDFTEGATVLVAALSADNKSAVKQIYITGAKGAVYTLKDAYLAVADATPEAQLGSASGIHNVTLGQAGGIRYNLAGQQVDASYKGVVVENGRKFIVK